jgi:hypothetical protein
MNNKMRVGNSMQSLDNSQQLAVVAIPCEEASQNHVRAVGAANDEFEHDEEKAVLCMRRFSSLYTDPTIVGEERHPATYIITFLTYFLSLVVGLSFLIAVVARCVILPAESGLMMLFRLRKQKYN